MPTGVPCALARAGIHPLLAAAMSAAGNAVENPRRVMRAVSGDGGKFRSGWFRGMASPFNVTTGRPCPLLISQWPRGVDVDRMTWLLSRTAQRTRQCEERNVDVHSV